MKHFQKILVGIDFSEASSQALRQAVEIASGEGGRVTAIHALSATEIESYQRGCSVPKEEMLAAYRKSIDLVVEKHIGPDAGVTPEAVVGAPYHELVKRVDEGGFDLLVLGSRGRESGANEVGFFAAKCVRHAKVPVLLARGGVAKAFGRVVACIDFSDSMQVVLDAALRVAVDDGAALDVVHAVRPPWEKATHVLFDLTTVEDDDFKAQYREILASEMEGAVKGIAHAAGVEVETHVIEHPNPEQAIINFLREKHAALAVVGRSGHTSKILKHYLIGSTAERIIHRSSCSVLTIPGV